MPRAVREELEAEAERRAPKESGGVVLGYADPSDPGWIEITHQIGPGINAVHARDSFTPDASWQQEQIAATYAASGRVSTYLGDWHSHPLGCSRPSRLDRATARRIARCAEARAPHPLLLILHGDPSDWQLTAYRRGRWRLGGAELKEAP